MSNLINEFLNLIIGLKYRKPFGASWPGLPRPWVGPAAATVVEHGGEGGDGGEGWWWKPGVVWVARGSDKVRVSGYRGGAVLVTPLV
jgi:hypothetical protein